jgi:hypothetical protein
VAGWGHKKNQRIFGKCIFKFKKFFKKIMQMLSLVGGSWVQHRSINNFRAMGVCTWLAICT